MEGKPDFNSGATALTNTLHGMIKSMTDRPPVLDFGIINSDYSLKINTFGKPIPKNEYSVCRQLLYDPSVKLTETYVDGEHGHPDASPPGIHQHDVKLPKKMRWLKPGQKVLVAVVGNEFVVIDIIFSAKWLGVCEPPWD